MGEIKTAPVKAQHIPDEAVFMDESWHGKVPGSFRLGTPDSDGEQTFWYVCPCGCGVVGPIAVGNGFKPSGRSPSWEWNGSLDAPTLMPSVHHIGHWHGWLRSGVWESC